MIGLLRRLFRRTPPHLRCRVPVDCGEGRIGPPAWLEPGRIGVKHEWGTEPDEEGRAFLLSVPPLRRPRDPYEAVHGPLNDRTLTYADGTTYKAARAMDQHLQHHPEEAPSGRFCDCTGSLHRAENDCPPPEFPRYVRRELGNGWVTHTLESLERPKPAENARRYTDEDGTW